MRENEVVVRSGRKIAESEYWEVRDRGAPVEYVDIITELRHHNGVVDQRGLGYRRRKQPPACCDCW